MEKSADAFRTISEVADDLTLPQHVLRFWETRFPQIRPLKRAGGRRYYRPADVVLLKTIRQLLYDDGYTIKGVQRLLKEQGPKALAAPSPPEFDEPLMPENPIDAPALSRYDPEPEGLAAEQSAFESASENQLAAGPLYRDALVEAVTTVDDCLRILGEARRKT